MKKMYQIVLAVLCWPACLVAQVPFTGVVDSSFATNGSKMYDDNTQYQEMVYDKARDPQTGKMYLIGTAMGPAGNEGYVQRINADGSPDLTYGMGSKVLLNPTPGHDIILGGAMQADGKLVLCGTCNNNVLLYRLNIDGTPDTSFNLKGIKIHGVPNQTEVARDVIIDNAGKIVIAGAIGPNNSPSDFYIGRFLSNGDVDMGFGTNGFHSVNLGTPELFSRIMQLGSGAYLAAGTADGEVTVAKFTNGGQPDPVFFNNTGGRIISFGANFTNSSVDAIKELANGKLLVTGTCRHKDDGEDAYAYQLNNDGTDDAGFGINGFYLANYDIASKDTVTQCSDLMILDNGDILLSGDYQVGKRHDFMVIKLKPNGITDPAFGTNGMRHYHVDDLRMETSALMIRDDADAIFLCGNAIELSNPISDILVMKLKGKTLDVASVVRSSGNLSLYPNPAKDMLYISNPDAVKIKKGMITDMQGRVVAEIREGDLNNRIISLGKYATSLPAGNYMMLLDAGEESVRLQFVKQ